MITGIINIHVGIMFSKKFTDCTNTVNCNFMIVGSQYCNSNQINSTALPIAGIGAFHWCESGSAVMY